MDECDHSTEVTSADSERLITTFSDNQIRNTFAHVVNERVDGLTAAAKREIIGGKYPSECLVTNIKSGSRNKRRGQQKPYPRQVIIGDKKKRKVGLHHLAAYMSSKRFPEKDEVASHWLCDNPDCGNPAHVVWETQPENISRYGCKVALQKSAPNYRCHHVPVCYGHKSCFE